jgi:hypothetical protein
MTLTSKAQAVLAVIVKGANTRDAIASQLGVTVPVVNGSITALKRHGLVELDYTAGIVTATPEAASVFGGSTTAVVRTSKMQEARATFAKYMDKGRQVVLEHFRIDVGLTPKGASTYYQTLRRENDMAVMAFQRAKSPRKTLVAVKRTDKPS